MADDDRDDKYVSGEDDFLFTPMEDEEDEEIIDELTDDELAGE